MGKEFDITPVDVPKVETQYRRIVTQIPHPDSVKTLESLHQSEPISMRGQPPVVWERAEDCQVYDKHGNMWLDWSSGVLVTNAGHGMPEVRQAIIDQVNSGLLHNYVFPSEERAELAAFLIDVAPEGMDKVFLLTTGSESTENAFKLARTYGISKGGKKKIGFVGFERGFHGRTLGAQQAGGIPGQKDWIGNEDPAIVQVPFPDGYWTENIDFDHFCTTIEEKGVKPDEVCGVMLETYQGVGPDFAPVGYVRALAEWCKKHDVLLIFDEVQAGFGRTGKFWGFEHYGVVPDLLCFGKGVSSSLPLSGVIGRKEVMDQYPAGSMTSTHTGNPVCCAAALASLKKIVNEDLTGNAARLEPIVMDALTAIQKKYPDVIGHVTCKGLVGGMQTVKAGEKTPDPDLAYDIILNCFHKGLLFFAPVGAWGQTVKISPPLTITQDALEDGLRVLATVVDEVLAAR
ncbi:MAG: aspartate aminotransferase family protein [Candidatus Latescibacteria bacterium]|jgi:4-aminobutyrate aminotransferase / (S)-3-amino-2-methylpropionate transaminase / 5-aminovalerate transaminase|nr:aspartate aminotransferase family protein [Candidatus Latescibacterota bacterium]